MIKILLFIFINIININSKDINHREIFKKLNLEDALNYMVKYPINYVKLNENVGDIAKGIVDNSEVIENIDIIIDSNLTKKWHKRFSKYIPEDILIFSSFASTKIEVEYKNSPYEYFPKKLSFDLKISNKGLFGIQNLKASSKISVDSLQILKEMLKEDGLEERCLKEVSSDSVDAKSLGVLVKDVCELIGEVNEAKDFKDFLSKSGENLLKIENDIDKLVKSIGKDTLGSSSILKMFTSYKIHTTLCNKWYSKIRKCVPNVTFDLGAGVFVKGGLNLVLFEDNAGIDLFLQSVEKVTDKLSHKVKVATVIKEVYLGLKNLENISKEDKEISIDVVSVILEKINKKIKDYQQKSSKFLFLENSLY